jgi:hypothetical protein
MDFIMMPAGVYVICDLCYVMTDDEWDQYCDLTIDYLQCLEGEFTLPDGRRFATYRTAWGDGVYGDQFGKDYCVDSGSIGCILLYDIRAKNYDDIEKLGAIVTFNDDFETRGCLRGRDSDGEIHIGHIRIDTDPSYDEADEEE